MINALLGNLAVALDELTDQFREACPTVIIELISMSSDEVETLGAALNAYDLIESRSMHGAICQLTGN